jgi:hypothetical protein
MRFSKLKILPIMGVITRMFFAVLATIFVTEMYVQTKVPVSLFGNGVFFQLWNQGYVVLEGTWVMDGDKHAYPLNKSKIVCRSETKECTDSQASIQTGFGSPQLNVNEDVHSITRWDSDTLTYKGGSALCVDYVYTVSRSTKQVTGIRTIKPGSDSTCNDFSKEIRLRLTNGFDVYQQLQKEARPEALNIMIFVLTFLWGIFRIRNILRSES